MSIRGIHTTVSRSRAVVIVAAAGLALAVAGPASAEPKTAPAKKGCEVQLKGPGAGQSIVYADGYSFSVQAQDGKKHTYTCNDGTWTETVSLTAGGTFWRNIAIVDGTSNTLQAVRLA